MLRGSVTWIVAVSGAQSAASIELATGAPGMAMGGCSGTDAAPTLDQLQAYVASGRLRFVLITGGGGGGGGFGGRSTSSEIATWVAANGRIVTLSGGSSGGTLYDLAGLVAAAPTD